MDATQSFGQGSIWKLIIKMGVPSVISMIVVVIYNMADTFFVGQTHNDMMGRSGFAGCAGFYADDHHWYADRQRRLHGDFECTGFWSICTGQSRSPAFVPMRRSQSA